MKRIKFFKKLVFLFSFILFFFALLFHFISIEISKAEKENKENKSLIGFENINNKTGNQLIFLAKIEEEIKAGTLQYLKRVATLAEDAKAQFIIIKLDTAGGLLDSTKSIVDLLLETKIPVIVFVHKEGGWAFSAGTFILMAADYAIVHPEASIGAAQPVIAGTGEEVEQKMIEGTVSWIRSLAEINQRDHQIAEKFVRENLTLTGTEAKEINIIEETAKDLEELFLKLNISEPQIKEISPTLIERLFGFLSHPYLISLLLMIGGLGIVMAIRTGEFEISGAVALIALLIGIWGLGIIDFTFLGIALLLLGLALLMVELFFEPGFGLLGIIGTIIIVIGIFSLEAEPFFAPGLWDPMRMIILGAALTICVFFVIVAKKLAKTFRAKPKAGSESLIGLQAEVIKNLSPQGKVKLNGEIWSAKNLNGETIFKNTKVEIVKIKGNTLFVKKISE